MCLFNTKKKVRLNYLRRTVIRGTTQIVYDLSYTPHRLHQALCTNVAFTEDIYWGFSPFRVFSSEVIEKMNISICSHQCSSLCTDYNQVFVFVTAFICVKLIVNISLVQMLVKHFFIIFSKKFSHQFCPYLYDLTGHSSLVIS